MGFYKKVKFPFEVTKGKSKDLYQLRFMRKSELEPILRHNFRYNVTQMGKQLDIWFKEQLFTIETLGKEEERVLRSRIRLRQEIRNCKRKEYARKQENIREKLKKIKMKIMIMKVAQRFKDNVKESKHLNVEASKENDSDFLKLSKNKHIVQGNALLENSKKYCETNCNRADFVIQMYVHSNTEEYSLPDEHTFGNIGKTSKWSSCASKNVKRYNSCDEYDQSDENEDNPNDELEKDALHYDGMSESGQRQLSSQSLRMETIPEMPEEFVSTVEIDIDKKQRIPKVDKRHLNILQENQFQKKVHDITDNDTAPLLNEVVPSHLRSSHGRKIPDQVDKKTQISDKTLKQQRKKLSCLKNTITNIENTNVTKSIGLKVAHLSHLQHFNRAHSPNSNSCNYGSLNDKEYDHDCDNGFEPALRILSTDNCRNNSNSNSNELLRNSEFAVTMTKYTSIQKADSKVQNSVRRDSYETLQSVKNINANLPNLERFVVQIPYVQKYRERNFFVKAKENNRSSGTVKNMLQKNIFSDCVNRSGISQDQLTDNEQISDDIRKGLNKEKSILQMHIKTKTTEVFKRTTDTDPTPNSPDPKSTSDEICETLSNRRSLQKNFKRLLITKKRDDISEEQRIHGLVISEPVQKYERTKIGTLEPFGTPVFSKCEIPSLKDRYYREKLLKAERDNTLQQNIKLKRFMDKFDKGQEFCKFPTIAGSPSGQHLADTNIQPTPAYQRHHHNADTSKSSHIQSKVYKSDHDAEYKKLIVPGISSTSLRLLKNCRYLREYKPVHDDDSSLLQTVKETSWNRK